MKGGKKDVLRKKKTAYVYGEKRKESAALHQIYEKILRDIKYVTHPMSRRILARKIFLCRSLSAKESLITGLFCGKRKILGDMRYDMEYERRRQRKKCVERTRKESAVLHRVKTKSLRDLRCIYVCMCTQI